MIWVQETEIYHIWQPINRSTSFRNLQNLNRKWFFEATKSTFLDKMPTSKVKIRPQTRDPVLKFFRCIKNALDCCFLKSTFQHGLLTSLNSLHKIGKNETVISRTFTQKNLQFCAEKIAKPRGCKWISMKEGNQSASRAYTEKSSESYLWNSELWTTLFCERKGKNGVLLEFFSENVDVAFERKNQSPHFSDGDYLCLWVSWGRSSFLSDQNHPLSLRFSLFTQMWVSRFRPSESVKIGEGCKNFHLYKKI